MSYPPSPEFETFIRDFITSHATTIFAAVPPPHDDGTVEPLIFTLHSNLLTNPAKEGALPASKAAIEALPTVTVTEQDDCAICLTEMYLTEYEAKEMPCKHRYHSDCITKWLGVHGSCPVCRYEMPVDEEEEKKRRDGGVGWQVTVTVVRSGSVDEPDLSGSGSVEDVDVEMVGGGGNLDQNSMEDLD
ncbi:putative transcription factor C2H2 family [Helianthus annuus]|nr:putative transcription factor C2H2 family [Helianthus annuus]